MYLFLWGSDYIYFIGFNILLLGSALGWKNAYVFLHKSMIFPLLHPAVSGRPECEIFGRFPWGHTLSAALEALLVGTASGGFLPPEINLCRWIAAGQRPVPYCFCPCFGFPVTSACGGTIHLLFLSFFHAVAAVFISKSISVITGVIEIQVT